MKTIFDGLHLELFESLKIGLAICDMEGKLLYVNSSYADLIGHELTDVYNLSYWDITPIKYEQAESEQLSSLENKGEYGPYDKEYIHKSGNLIPVRLYGKIVSINGEQYIWSTVEDITFSKSKEVHLELESKSKLIEESLNEIFIFDIDTLKFVYVNESALQNIGYEENELLNMTPVDIKPEYNFEDFKKIIQPLKNGQVNVLILETAHQRKDGSLYYVDINLRLGHFLGKSVFTAFIIDNSIKKGMELQQQSVLQELDRSYQIQKAIQDQAPYAIIASDTEGMITHFNIAAEQMLGYSAEEIVNKTSPAIFHIESEIIDRAKVASRILGRMVEPGFKSFVALSDYNIPNEFEWTYVKKDGTQFPVLLSITCLKDAEGNTTGYLGMANDITERKEKELELKLAKENAERALSSKSEFLANMSHEIRTPMNGIIGMSSLLESEINNQDSLKKLNIIQNSANALLTILNDILDLSKIEAGKVKLENLSFNIYDLIEETVEINRTTITDKDLKLKMQINPNVPRIIISDQFRLRQILNNLISNAIKFTSFGHVSISLDSLQDKDSLVLCFIIQDTGIGIEKTDQAKLFKSFSQADSSTTRHFGGTGLGLAITKSLINQMGGEISLSSEKNHGSTFEFTIQVKVGDESTLDKDALSSTNQLPKPDLKILVVEDNRVNQQVAKGFISKLGYQVDIANDGLEALQMLEQQTFDLIFMDCHMPNMDGFTATKEIVQKYKQNRPFIVALTASSMEEDIKKCYDSGMDEFISKPFSLKELDRIFDRFKSLKINSNS